MDGNWVNTIHQSLLIVLGAAMAECVRAKGGAPAEALAATRAAVERPLEGISITGKSAAGQIADLHPELMRRMKKLLDEAEKLARQELALAPAARRAH